MSAHLARWSPCSRRKSLRWIAWCCAAIAGLLAPSSGSSVNAADAPAQVVSLVVDYQDGVELRFTQLAWKQDMTVLDAVKTAQVHPHGVAFTMRGAGTTAFVTKIGDVANEGSGRKSRNWMFQVNQQQSDEGIGSRTLQPGDAVLWKFETYNYNN